MWIEGVKDVSNAGLRFCDGELRLEVFSRRRCIEKCCERRLGKKGETLFSQRRYVRQISSGSHWEDCRQARSPGEAVCHIESSNLLKPETLASRDNVGTLCSI